MRCLGPGLVLLACALAPGAAQAGEEPFLVHRGAQAHYDLAGKHAARGDLRRAAAELDAAHAIEPHPELLFVRAELRRRLGECSTALTLYRDFVASRPSQAATRQAEDGIAACEQQLAATQPRPEPAPKPEATPPLPAPMEPPPRRPPWHRDPAGGALLGVGIAGLAATVGLAVLAAGATNRAGQTYLASDYDGHRRTALAWQVGTGAAAAVSAGLLIGAGLRYRAVRRRDRALGAWFDAHGGGLRLSARF